MKASKWNNMTNILIQSLLQKRWKKRTKTKWDAHDPNVVDKTIKTSWEVNPWSKLEGAQAEHLGH